MILIEGQTANELLINAANALIKYGKISSPRGMKTIEIRDAWLTLNNPLESIATLEERKTNMDYLKEELNWYINGNANVSKIEQRANMWSRIKNSNNTANSNYGKLAMVDIYNGKSQLEWCVDSIKKDIDTRQAVINYNQPQHKYESCKDFPCTLTQFFRVNNNQLDTNVIMRSNDMIYGLTYDMPWFSYILNKISKETNLKSGKYHHLAHSFHVYEKHFDMLDKISNSKNLQKSLNINKFLK